MNYRTITDGLLFPEGPIAMPDGTVLLVEIGRGTLPRVFPDGRPLKGPNDIVFDRDGRFVCRGRRDRQPASVIRAR